MEVTDQGESAVGFGGHVAIVAAILMVIVHMHTLILEKHIRCLPAWTAWMQRGFNCVNEAIVMGIRFRLYNSKKPVQVEYTTNRNCWI
uniref:Uncharacterized protein n=1 Tax=Oryza brachyantha TaxID=4533 RepID=J3L0B4_ORYBR